MTLRQKSSRRGRVIFYWAAFFTKGWW